jgi:hypothetical protein
MRFSIFHFVSWSSHLVAPSIALVLRQEVSWQLSRKLILNSTLPSILVTLLGSGGGTCRAATVSPSREVDVGRGFDLLLQRKVPGDVTYPLSMEGPWKCQRIVTKVEGDLFQAETAFQSLGGKEKLTPDLTEQFQTRYIESPLVGSSGVVADRGFEMTTRSSSSNVQWDVAEPNLLTHDNIKLRIVKRSVEDRSDQGFGFEELIRVDETLITRAVQLKRRYRPTLDENGSEILEGLEIMKTFRVLDGVTGTELPTSTTKTTIRMIPQSEASNRFFLR